MGRTLAEVFVSVRGETSRLGPDIQKGVGRVDASKAGEEAGRKFGHSFASGAKVLLAGTAALLGSKALLGGAKEAVNASSDLNETVSKTEQIFGKSSAQVLRFGDSSAKALGQSKNAALSAAANYGNLFNNLGFTQKKSAEMSTQLLKTATDLASFNNASPQEMLDGISSALAGEYDPLQRYGLAISAATVQQEALRSGLVKSTKDITPAIQARAAYALILQQTGKAQGDFGRTAAGLANQERIAAAQSENLRATIGEGLRPAALGLFATLNKDVLPAFTSFAEDKAPKLGQRLGDLAERTGPKVIGFFKQQVTAVSALAAAYHEGDVTSDGYIGKAERLGVLLRQGKTGVDALAAAYREGDVTSGGYVGVMERIGVALRGGRLGVSALVAAYKEGDVTSDGFVGTMEKIGVTTRRFVDYVRGTAIPGVRDFFDSFKGGDGGDSAKKTGEAFGSIGDSLVKLGPALAEFRDEIPSAVDLLTVGASVLGFFADHVDTLVKYMPLLVAGFVAYKGAQALANAAAVLAVPTKVAEVLVNRQLVKSNRELIASRAGATASQLVEAAATTGATVATEANTGAKNVGILATLRARAAALASSAAQLVVRGATLAWTGAQWLLNAALSANPIGLVIAAVALLAAGFILAWKRSETFRDVVKGAFSAVASAGRFMWEKVLKPVFALIVGAWLAVAGGIIDGAAHAFGWVPGLGGKLKAAAKEFDKFRDRVNGALSGVKSREITVTAKASVLMGQGLSRTDAIATSLHRAAGGPVFGAGNATSDSIPAMLSNGEHVWTAKEVSAVGGHTAVGRMRKAALAGQVAAFAEGGPVGFSISPRLQGEEAFAAAIQQFNSQANAVATAAARRVLTANGGNVTAYARSVAGTPYSWGDMDCSGFVSRLVEAARGLRIGPRRFTTDTLPAGDFATSGNVAPWFRIGWFRGNPGHVAATVNGVGMESRGGDGVVVDGYNGSSRGADYGYFTNHAYLKLARGGAVRRDDLPGDPPFDLLDPRGRHYRPGLAETLRAGGKLTMQTLDSGGYVMPGLNLIHNGTGRPERTRTAVQEDRLAAAIDRLARAIREQPVNVQLNGRTIARAVRDQNTRDPGSW